jgi:hypothetical protein
MGRLPPAVTVPLSSLSEALKYRNSDGPTKTLLAYMKKSNFTAPPTWKQFRPLTSK